MQTADFAFELPNELIAQFPSPERSASRLLYLDPNSGSLIDSQFRDLPRFLRAGDVLVFNDTRVIKARLFGVKETGGKIELLVERVLDEERVLAQIHASHPPQPNAKLLLAEAIAATVLGRRGEFYLVRFDAGEPVLDLLTRYGEVPLPPYIRREATASDECRYQTVYARVPGAVAAPTAGLHFDGAMLATLKHSGIAIAYLTLHVGAGTFQPVRAQDLSRHKMHSEVYHVPAQTIAAIDEAKARGGRVTAVGSTALRALEAAASHGELEAGWGETDLFITPGCRFRVVERLLTNFHLPRSTLYMLVCAFAGMDNMRRAYAHAMTERYRFFSYGDAMLIENLLP
jgi:S-adenosylmethionine:tRNA ribosyltransferase-isomerase